MIDGYKSRCFTELHELATRLAALPDAPPGSDCLRAVGTWAEVTRAHELGVLTVSEFYIISLARKHFRVELGEASTQVVEAVRT
jgi:hypothetical protein